MQQTVLSRPVIDGVFLIYASRPVHNSILLTELVYLKSQTKQN